VNKKISAIFAILIIALTLVGISYACWFKTLTINGYVKTGDLDVQITSVGTDDGPLHYPDPDDPGIPYGNDPGYTKDVGCCYASIDRVVDPTNETLKINITNAYPCYHCSVHFTVSNLGTVPVKYNGTQIIGAPPCITIDPGNTEGEQIDPYPQVPWHKDYTIYIHIEQTAVQNTNYVFYIHFLFVQWNEYPYIP
jgi:hypothetical protein